MSKCGCIYVDNDEFVTMIKKELVNHARKRHTCNECGRTINIKEPYEYHFYTFDGKTTIHKFCIDCISLRDTFFCEGYTYEQIRGYLIEHIEEMEGKISSDCILNLTPGASEFVLDEIQKVFDELNWCDDQEGEC